MPQPCQLIQDPHWESGTCGLLPIGSAAEVTTNGAFTDMHLCVHMHLCVLPVTAHGFVHSFYGVNRATVQSSRTDLTIWRVGSFSRMTIKLTCRCR